MWKITSIFLTFFVLLANQVTMASASKAHHRGNISPFDQNVQKKSPHCLLNKHRGMFFCPHGKLLFSKKYTKNVVISKHCGNLPHASTSTFNFATKLVGCQTIQIFRFSKSRLKGTVAEFQTFYFFDSPYHPPRFI